MRYVVIIFMVLSSQVFAKESRPQNAWSKLSGPTTGAPMSIGGYANGCLIGADTLAEKGVGFESIRRFRNRYYGHPKMVKLIEWLGKKKSFLVLE